MSAVHFIIHSGRLSGKHLKNGLVTSVDTYQWILVLLAMPSRRLVPQGYDAVQVTVRRIVSGGPW